MSHAPGIYSILPNNAPLKRNILLRKITGRYISKKKLKKKVSTFDGQIGEDKKRKMNGGTLVSSMTEV